MKSAVWISDLTNRGIDCEVQQAFVIYFSIFLLIIGESFCESEEGQASQRNG